MSSTYAIYEIVYRFTKSPNFAPQNISERKILDPVAKYVVQKLFSPPLKNYIRRRRLLYICEYDSLALLQIQIVQ